MSYKTRITFSIIVAILLVVNVMIAFNANQSLKWLWLIVALFSVSNVFLVYKREHNQPDR